MPPNSLRTPRLRVLSNNTLLPGVLSAEITSNNHYAADRFRLTLQVSAIDANTWSATPEALLDIQFSLDGFSWTSLLQGEVDQLHLDPRRLQLTLEGRDLTARLIQARTQETFANQTSSEIASALAARHGLTANVSHTTTPAGTYWQLEHDRIALDSFCRAVTEWDLLTTLAAHEGFDVWIAGTTLNFQPAPTALDPTAILRPLPTPAGPANIISIQLTRSLVLAGNIQVTVKSWNSRQANSFTQTTQSPPSPSTAPVQTYTYVVPNLTPDAALKLAQTRLSELSRHERVIEVEMPGELTFTPRQQILLAGTNTAFDQIYWIDEITRQLDVHHGFTQRLKARNTSTPAAT